MDIHSFQQQFPNILKVIPEGKEKKFKFHEQQEQQIVAAAGIVVVEEGTEEEAEQWELEDIKESCKQLQQKQQRLEYEQQPLGYSHHQHLKQQQEVQKWTQQRNTAVATTITKRAIETKTKRAKKKTYDLITETY